jgi:glycosyltransferase involved in cell wall biosynthesis
VSNYYNHHQLYFCTELIKRIDKFWFISTRAIPETTIQFGYENINYQHEYIIRTYEGASEYEKAKKLIGESDVVIFGDCPSEYIKFRNTESKTSFLYNERFFKKGMWRRYIPTTYKKIYNRILKYPNIKILCASAFLPLDLQKCGYSVKNCYKWGYFTEFIDYSKNSFEDKKKNVRPLILWAGRFIEWKHAMDAIDVAIRLLNDGYDFDMNIIGSGKLEKELKSKVHAKGLSGRAKFLGSLSPQRVRAHMEKADIYLFTSDKNEGWGAVLNEAMNSGCAVIASHAIGSVPFLIRNKENGMIYKSGDINELYEITKYLLGNQEECRRLGKNAYFTIKNEYNPEIAAERLVRFAMGLIKNEQYEFNGGVLSPAQILKENYFYQKS